MAIMVARDITVDANSLEEDVGTDLVVEAVDAEDKLSVAKVVVVAVDGEVVIETKGSTLTFTLT